MKFKRYFTTEGIHPYDEVNWIITTAEIKNEKDPSKSFKQEGVEFPDFYSENAINIIASKYFYGKLGEQDREFSLKQLINRIVNTNADWGIEQNYFDSNEDVIIYVEELKYMLLHQMFSFNSPVWFNIGNPYAKQQVSACFIVGVDDNMESIEESYITEMEIYRSGSGSGTNYSKLRSRYENISGGGFSSGPCSFMRPSDAGAKVTKSGGKTRRAAQMKILDIDHPEIEEFIWQKKVEEDKAKALIAAGYDSHYDAHNGAYDSVFFQNSNQSVSITNYYMKQLREDSDWNLLSRKGKVLKTVKADYLFNELSKCTWETGDPGVQFIDTINEWHTCRNDELIEASNPCSEYFFINETSCNLASLRLTKFWSEEKGLDVIALEHASRIGITAMDIWIAKAYYPTEKIAIATRKYRTLGLGYTDLGALLLLNKFPYASVEARLYAASITALMHFSALDQSSKIAKELGSFESFEKNRAPYNHVIDLHCAAFDELFDKQAKADISFTDINTRVIELIQGLDRNQFRNAQVTVLAPTGTISFMMDAETTGIEPILFPTIYKKLAGGGNLILDTPSIAKVKKMLGYHENAEILAEHRSIFATSLSTDNPIPWKAHLLMMAAVQPFLSGGISKTVNMPNNSTIDDIKSAYQMAYTHGLKSVAIYRDGCKNSQPLNTKITDTKPSLSSNLIGKVSIRKKLPETRDSITHKFNIGGHEGYLTVGLYPDSTPGEIFVNMSKAGSTIRGLLDSWAIVVSMLLQHGCSLETIVNKLKNAKFDPAGMTGNKQIRFTTSPIDYIGRWLENEFLDDENDDDYVDYDKETRDHIEEEKKLGIIREKIIKIDLNGPPCPECGHLTTKAGTCYRCSNCGSTTGCG